MDQSQVISDVEDKQPKLTKALYLFSSNYPLKLYLGSDSY